MPSLTIVLVEISELGSVIFSYFHYTAIVLFLELLLFLSVRDIKRSLFLILFYYFCADRLVFVDILPIIMIATLTHVV